MFLAYGCNADDVLGRWREMQSQYPQVASIARDFLAVPAAGVGVERLFNSARDIISYRRHNLKPATIRLLMMLMCMDRFDLKEEFRLAGSLDDLEDAIESEDEKDTDAKIVKGLISDTEEDFNDESNEDESEEEIHPMTKEDDNSLLQSLDESLLLPQNSQSSTLQKSKSSQVTSFTQQTLQAMRIKRKTLNTIESTQPRKKMSVKEGKRKATEVGTFNMLEMSDDDLL